MRPAAEKIVYCTMYIAHCEMKSVVASHSIERDELLKRDFIPRLALGEASKSMAGDLIKVVIGPRRAGKSVFALPGISGAGRCR